MLIRKTGLLEDTLGSEAVKTFLPMQLGDVPGARADVSDLVCDVDFAPTTPRFVAWYRDSNEV